MKKVTIIIPVYNAERFIERAYKSAIKQSIDDKEIIFVDDGSADGSLEIMRNICAVDERVRILLQEHKGSGEARNFALREASGTYVSFLDADDEYIDSGALQKLCYACEKRQMPIAGGYRINDNYGKEEKDPLLRQFITRPEIGTIVNFRDLQEDFHYHNYIFNKRFLSEKNIWFPKYLRYQDPVFLLNAMTATERFIVVPVEMYKYHYGHQNFWRVTEYIADALKGISDNLAICNEKGYEVLRHKLIERLNCDFFPFIMGNLNADILHELLQINSLLKDVGEERKLRVLTEIKDWGEKRIVHELFDDMEAKFEYIRRMEGGFSDCLKKMGINNVVIYGLGHFGSKLINALEAENIINIVAGIDQEKKKLKNIRTLAPEDEIPKCDAVIIAVLKYGDVLEKLKERRIKNLYCLNELMERILRANECEQTC